MSLIRWSPFIDPFREFESLVPNLMSRQMVGFMPELDIYQKDDEVIVEASLPGIDPKNVQISIENDVLTISGEQQSKREVEEESFYRQEIHRGHFHRSVALPKAVDGDRAKAVYADGLLKISVPIQERAKPKQVKVEVIDKK